MRRKSKIEISPLCPLVKPCLKLLEIIGEQAARNGLVQTQLKFPSVPVQLHIFAIPLQGEH